MNKNNTTAFLQEQYNSIYPEGIENHYWQKARFKIINHFIKKNGLLELNFLEIGCGKGVVLNELKKIGFTIRGVELAEIQPLASVKNAIHTGISFTDLDEQIKSDTTGILLFDVIEHIQDPNSFIKEILENFPNAKYIIGTAPAMQDIWSNYDQYNGHFKRYNHSDLMDLTSCRLIDYGFFFHILYPLTKMLLKLKKNRNTTITSPKSLLIYLHKIIAFCFYSEYKLLPKETPGSSIYFVLTRK